MSGGTHHRADDAPHPRQSTPSLLRMASPLVVSFWMRAVVTFVDTIFAARLGDAAVAGIGLTIPLEFLMIAVWVGASTGLTSVLSRTIGARHARKVEQYVALGWRLARAIAPVFALVGAGVWWVAPRMELADDVARAFQIYGTVLISGSAFTAFWSILPDSLVKAHQDTRSTMWAGIYSNVINVILNTLFLFVFHWGIFGIALSTVIGRLGGLIYALHRARLHEEQRRQLRDAVVCEPDPEPLRAILELAVPSSITFILMSLETAFVNMLLARMEFATEAIAAYSIYFRIVLFALQPIIALSVALLPYAARRLGQRDHAGIERGFRQAATASTLYSVLIVGPLLVWAAPWLARALSESTTTARYATFAIRTVPLSCLAGALFLMARPVFEAHGRGQPGLIMAVVRYVILTGPLAWAGLWLARTTGHPELYGLLAGLLAAGAISSAAFSLWLRRSLARWRPAAASV